MEIINFDEFDAHVSDEIMSEVFSLGGNYKDNIRYSLTSFMDNINLEANKLKKFLELYSKANNLPKKYAILFAHGTSLNKKWVYQDNKKERNVQSWVDSNDSKYSGLIFRCCNPGSHVPKSKKSALVIPDYDVSGPQLGIILGKSTCFEIFLPNGLKTDAYTIDYDIFNLEKILEKNKSIK